MPTYVALIKWTDQGVKSAPDSLNRFRQARTAFERQGVRFHSIHWTQGGDYDLVGILEAPDDQTLAAVLLKLAGQGNVRTQTLRAFDEQEMGQVIQKMG